jgi:hypothetical protein
MKPKVIVPPGAEPITVEEARMHLEAQSYGESDTDPADDAQIADWIIAAREFAESFTGLSFTQRTLEIALDEFPRARAHGWGLTRSGFGGGRSSSRVAPPIELPMGPVVEIVSIQVGEESDGPMDAAAYVLDDYATPHAVRATGASWPSVPAVPNGIKIRYVAGYALDSSEGGELVPRQAVAAMKLIIGHLYANREDSTETALQTLPNGAEALLRPLRVRLGMA